MQARWPRGEPKRALDGNAAMLLRFLFVLVISCMVTEARGRPPLYNIPKLNEADALLKQGKDKEGAALMLEGIGEATARQQYGAAYYYTWKLARRRSPAWDDAQRLQWYDLAESYLLKRDRDASVWQRVDMANLIQMLCEKETIYIMQGRMGSAALTTGRAEDYVEQYWGSMSRGLMPPISEKNQRIAFVHLLLDQADHKKRAGQLEESDATFMRCLYILNYMNPGEEVTQISSRTLNNLEVLLSTAGKDYEADHFREMARALHAQGADSLVVESNRLRYESKMQGPSEELFQKLLENAVALASAGRRASALSIRRRAASVLFEMDRSDEAEALFEEVITEARQNHYRIVTADAYFWRGKARSRLDIPGAEDDFCAALDFYRREAIKLNEYRVYKAYADFLRKNDRIHEALAMTDEALRLNDLMHLIRLRPELLAQQAATLLQAGELNAADAVWKKAQRLLENMDGLSDHRRISVLVSRLEYLAACGRDDELAETTAMVEAFIAKAELPEIQTKAFRNFDPMKYRTGKVALKTGQPDVSFQPVYSATRTQPNQEADSWFWLMNPSMEVQTGRLEVRGAKLLSWDPITDSCIEFVVDSGTNIPAAAGFEIDLQPKSTFAVHGIHQAPADQATGHVSIDWIGSGSQEVIWDVVGDAGRFVKNATYHAHLAQLNPFYSIPLYHEIGTQETDGMALNYRIRSSVPCRTEVYGMGDSRLLAVDANGDGLYSGEGDMLTTDIDRNGYPDIDQPTGRIVVYVFPSVMISDYAPLDLTIEILVNGTWMPIGTDRLIAMKDE